jgi:outer membrane biosynthesis protein TonB
VVTARPRWSTTTLLTAAPRNVRVRVAFDRAGRVVLAEFVGEGSGYADVDEPLLHAIYRWRASGERIARLRGEETLPIVFSVILRD